jgi:hypothetical protein
MPELAVAFIEAVEQGRAPVKDMRERFGFTAKEAEKRSWRLRQSGWLPRGCPTMGDWLTLAQEMVSARLDVLVERELARHARLERKLERTRHQLQREFAQASRPPVQMRRNPKPRRSTASERASVLDVFG